MSLSRDTNQAGIIGGSFQKVYTTLDLLLATHFPNSVAIVKEAASAAVHHAKHLD